MKRIVAFVKPNMLDDVIFALHELDDFPGATICETQDIGRGPREAADAADRTPFHAYPRLARIEIVCPAARVGRIAETIRRKARTGLADDGTIVVSAVENAIRIGE